MGVKKFQLSDMGNAERLVAAHGQDFRFAPNWNKWLVWEEGRWSVDYTLEIERRAKDTVRRIYGEAQQAADDAERKRTAAWALQSESGHRIAEMTKLARPSLTVTPGELDTDPYLLCCANGVLDLRTGELLEPRRENYITKRTQVAYDAKALCPTWERVLERVLPDKEARSYVQKAVGYTLTGDVSEQCLFFLFGEGKNGKTTFIETISAVLGDYFRKTRSDTLMLKRNAGIPNDVAALFGSRLVTVSEISTGQTLDEGLVKDLTGGDTIAARFLHAEVFNFKAGFKLWLYGNHKPTIRGKDEGIWRRIRLIPFLVTIPKEERDTHLTEKLARELPGILRWGVQGCLMWQKEGFCEPPAILDAVNEYRREQDALSDFLVSVCVFDRPEQVTKKELWSVYEAWAQSTGEESFDTQRRFNEEVKKRPGVKDGRGAGNVAIWKGIGLREACSLSSGVTEVDGVTDFHGFSVESLS